MRCPFCTNGYIWAKITTKVYRIGYYTAVRRCTSCNGTGNATQTEDRKMIAAGE